MDKTQHPNSITLFTVKCVAVSETILEIVANANTPVKIVLVSTAYLFLLVMLRATLFAHNTFPC